ncbi:unnamed protein product [Allacma fusca]|uniref:Uncharacterized protein n=1 Tax=Allacma fusca TaxID=39272 RepID=A0A8J2L119_9HEXA|nr:unnamed protein product [Allacma fusca]
MSHNLQSKSNQPSNLCSPCNTLIVPGVEVVVTANEDNDESDDENHVVGRIYGIAKEERSGFNLYRVHWLHYESEFDTWEPEKHIHRQFEKIREFHSSVFEHCNKRYFSARFNNTEEFWFKELQQTVMDYIGVLDDDSLNPAKSILPAADSSVIPTSRIQVSDVVTDNNFQDIKRQVERRNRSSIQRKVKKFQCKDCKKSYVHQKNLVKHRYSLHRSIKINIADEFQSSTSSKGQRNSAHDQSDNSTLLNHSMNESDVPCEKAASKKDQNFVTDSPICNSCKRKFRGFLDLNEHLPQCIQFRRELCHVKTAVNFSDAMVQTDNICLRETETQTVTKFQVGNKQIEKKNGLSCSTCNAILSTKSSLKRHYMLIHTDLEPEICSGCEGVFSSIYSLELHLQRNTCKPPRLIQRI